MPWTRRTVTPLRPAQDRNIVVETSRVVDAEELAEDPVWKLAPLTKGGRAAILRPAGDRIEAAMLRGWRVRRLGAVEHCALVLRLGDHLLHGGLVSAAPQRVALEYRHKGVVVTPELVAGVWGADEYSAFGTLGDILVGTHPRPRRRARRRVRADDLDALVGLAPG